MRTTNSRFHSDTFQRRDLEQATQLLRLKMLANAPLMTRTILRSILVVAGFLFLVSLSLTSAGPYRTLRSKLPFEQKGEKLAFITYLAQSIPEPELDNDDKYYIATRMLGYQLMHAPNTRSDTGIPFIVIVPPSMRQSKRDRLVLDGATVIEVQIVDPAPWMENITIKRYRNQFTKLRLFELDEYERILYIDSDMLVTRRLDDIFNTTEASGLQYNRHKILKEPGRADQPANYLMAGAGDLHSYDHDWPPPVLGQMNGGFFLTRPSKAIFKYYMSVMQTPRAFSPQLAEQALLNYAHRPKGNMPFRQLHYSWNSLLPNPNDFKEEHRAATIHEKWWRPESAAGIFEMFAVVQKDMWAFYDSLESNESNESKGG